MNKKIVIVSVVVVAIVIGLIVYDVTKASKIAGGTTAPGSQPLPQPTPAQNNKTLLQGVTEASKLLNVGTETVSKILESVLPKAGTTAIVEAIKDGAVAAGGTITQASTPIITQAVSESLASGASGADALVSGANAASISGGTAGSEAGGLTAGESLIGAGVAPALIVGAALAIFAGAIIGIATNESPEEAYQDDRTRNAEIIAANHPEISIQEAYAIFDGSLGATGGEAVNENTGQSEQLASVL